VLGEHPGVLSFGSSHKPAYRTVAAEVDFEEQRPPKPLESKSRRSLEPTTHESQKK